jgi:hypothetical protein
LASHRSIADLEVQDQKAGYPVNYLLDGQQRLSTICGALYWSPGEASSVWNIAYDLRQGKFLHLTSNDAPPLHIVPMRRLANPSEYFSHTVGLDADSQDRAKALFDRFTDYQVAIVTLGDMSIRDVGPVFERINSTGTRLTIVDLMRAATWSPTFDLVEAIDNMLTELEPKKFGAIDQKTILRSVAAAAGRGFASANMDDLRSREEPELKQDVATTLDAAKRAADFLSTEIGVPRAEALPYTNQFAVLTEIFRNIPHPNTVQLAAIKKWFWHTTLSSYFGGWNTGQMASDRQAVLDFAVGSAEALPASGTIPTASIWHTREFRSNSATSKMLALMLANAGPVDPRNGQVIDVGKSLSWSNDKEYHHFFPRAFLATQGVAARKGNVISNIIMLTSVSNIAIRAKPPSVYLGEIRSQVGEDELRRRLRTALVFDEAYEAATADDYEKFIRIRARDLQRNALALVGADETGAAPAGVSEAAVTADDADVDSTE